MEVIQIILTSFLAGILLNFMPCVLPILGIKLQSLRGVSSPKEVKQMCVFTSLGIMLFMLLTAWIFQMFSFFFWGFQLQSPLFISFLIVVMVFLFFLSIGKINFNLNIQYTFKSKIAESIFYGFLIVVFSISCTAPVIGSAIAFASFSHANLWIVMFFIGLGLSAPYLIFILFPNIVLQINKARFIGVIIKYLSSFLILCTTFFLCYVLYGALKERDFLQEEGRYETGFTTVPFTEERLADFIAKGYIIIVNFDASWCINCKGNNLLTFNTEEFKKYIAQNNIIFMKADVTIKNPNLENFMAKFGLHAVPFTAVFSSKHPDGKLMPAFLTTQILMK